MRIEVRGLTKRFGSAHALRDVGFDTPAGRRVALIGPNGSGKSTLNRVLMGLLDFDGEVRLDGHSPLRDRVAVAQRMAYVPQIAPTLAVPVGELLRAFGRIRDIPAARLRRIGGELGLDLEELAPQPFRSLSGGMRQKVLIALALASRASLLILDEPTGSLDARSRERFFELFGALAGDATVVLCSHRLEEVRQLVDHVLFLAEGRLIDVREGAVVFFLSPRLRMKNLDDDRTAVVGVIDVENLAEPLRPSASIIRTSPLLCSTQERSSAPAHATW